MSPEPPRNDDVSFSYDMGAALLLTRAFNSRADLYHFRPSDQILTPR